MQNYKDTKQAVRKIFNVASFKMRLKLFIAQLAHANFNNFQVDKLLDILQ